MQIQLIRNATLRLTYNGHLLLIDPFLAAKHTFDPFDGKDRNPTVDLPVTPEAVIAGVEAVIVSHLHSDHFDAAAQERLPKDIPLFCQPGNDAIIAEKGFQNIQVIADRVEWQGIHITRTAGQHGNGQLAERMGRVSGFVFRAEGEPVVYWAGDTIWYTEVEQVINDQQPDVIITHSGGARFGDSAPIIMDAMQTVAVCQAAPEATVVAVHLEALDHCPVTRAALRSRAQNEGIADERLRIPADGQSITL